MALSDTLEDAVHRLAERERKIVELERLIRWQADGSHPEGRWVESRMEGSSSTSANEVDKLTSALDGASGPLAWVKVRPGIHL